MLGLQAERVALPVGPRTRATVAAVEEIRGIELDAGLAGEHFHDTAAPGLAHARREPRLARRIRPQDEIVVIAAAQQDLLVARTEARADRRRRTEVEGCAVDGPDLAGRNEIRRHRRESVGC